jgi:hypothetical protein
MKIHGDVHNFVFIAGVKLFTGSPNSISTKCEKLLISTIFFYLSPQIFVSIQNDPHGYTVLRSPGETDSRKNPEVENLVSDPL